MGSSKQPSPPPVAATPDPVALADAQTQAQIKYLPQAAETYYGILQNPNYGLLANTRLQEDVRSQVFGQENAVRNQLLQNVLANLLSPTGITPDQQSAIDTRRGTAQNELQRAFRERANLGGNLYGGRAVQEETRAVGELQNQFAEEDIMRQERARLNAIQAALPALQTLFPNSGIVTPNFINPVASPEASLSAASANRGQDLAYMQAQQAAQAQQRSALYQALGQAAGSIGGAMALKCWTASVIYGSWSHPKTNNARKYIHYQAPEWFRKFYIAHGLTIARFIKDKPLFKRVLKPLFDFFAWRGGLING